VQGSWEFIYGSSCPRYWYSRCVGLCIKAETGVFGLERRFVNRDGPDLARLIIEAQVQHNLVGTPILKSDVVYWKPERATHDIGDLTNIRILSLAHTPTRCGIGLSVFF
jgi:hypothetical protein